MPISSTAKFNPVLNVLANERWTQGQGYIADQISPVFYTRNRRGSYYVWDQENIVNRVEVQKRAPLTEVPRRSMQLSEDEFRTVQYALGAEVSDEDRDQYSDVFNADQAAVNMVLEDFLYSQEIRVKDQALDASIPNGTAGAFWDTTSTPIDDVEDANASMRTATGLTANTLVITWDTFRALRHNAKILDNFSGVMRLDTIGIDELRSVFGIPNIIVANSLHNTANEGQSMNVADIWPHHAWLLYVTPGQDLRAPNWSRTFSYTGKGDGNLGTIGRNRVKVFSHYDNNVYGMKHDVIGYSGEKLTGASLAYRIEDVLSNA